MSTDKIRISDESVRKATGRTWREWEAALDDWGANDLSHKEIVALIGERAEVASEWWRQTVANGYEKLKGKRITGETEDAGFQIGVQRTTTLPLERAWSLLTSPEGTEAWLGAGAEIAFEQGERYRLADGTEGEVRVVRPNQHLRITWHPKGWPRSSVIQVRVTPKGEKTVISFHEEQLPGEKEREERRTFFKAALARIEELAKGEPQPTA